MLISGQPACGAAARFASLSSGWNAARVPVEGAPAALKRKKQLNTQQMGIPCKLIYKYQSDHTDYDTDDLIPGQSFMVEKIADEKKRRREKSALNNETCADLPAGLICVDPARFQADDHNAEDNGSPIQFSGFIHQISVMTERKIQYRTRGSADKISNDQ